MPPLIALPPASTLTPADELPIIADPTGTWATKRAAVLEILKLAYPVGIIIELTVATNPATLFGFGTWEEIGQGQFLVGQDAGQPEFATLGGTGGSKTHTLTTAEMPAHTHVQDAHGHAVTDPGHTHLTQRYPTATGGSSGFTVDASMSGTLADNTLPVKIATTGITVNAATATNQSAGGGAAHNNLPPYLVAKRWTRVA